MDFHLGVQVVVDISTKTCGPCKMIYPKVVEMSLAYPDAVFLKINGDTDNNTRVSLTTELFRLMYLHSETVFTLSLSMWRNYQCASLAYKGIAGLFLCQTT